MRVYINRSTLFTSNGHSIRIEMSKAEAVAIKTCIGPLPATDATTDLYNKLKRSVENLNSVDEWMEM